jgi:hypothetical protein
MKIRCCFVLSILAVLLITSGAANAWPIKSDEKLQKAKDVLEIYVKEIAEKDNYFDPHLVGAYVDGVMKSVNENNGQGVIISHDALKWCKITVILYDDENVKKVNLERHQKSFDKTLNKFKVDQNKWQAFVRQFNTSGYANTTTADGNLLYFYDYAKNCFMAKVTPWLDETKKPQAL